MVSPFLCLWVFDWAGWLFLLIFFCCTKISFHQCSHLNVMILGEKSSAKWHFKGKPVAYVLFLCHPPVFRRFGQHNGCMAKNSLQRLIKLIRFSPSAPLNQGESSFTGALESISAATGEGRWNYHRTCRQSWSRRHKWQHSNHGL